jgi:hypothetical protein
MLISAESMCIDAPVHDPPAVVLMTRATAEPAAIAVCKASYMPVSSSYMKFNEIVELRSVCVKFTSPKVLVRVIVGVVVTVPVVT